MPEHRDATSAEPPTGPPRPEGRPTTRSHHGDVLTDPYAWLQDADDPATLDHLRRENAWTAEVTAPLADQRERLFEEIRSRVQETDLSVPYRQGAWWYYVRTEEGKAYARHCRRPDDGSGTAMAPDGAEQLVVDENALAEGTAYLSLGVLDVSPDGATLA